MQQFCKALRDLQGSQTDEVFAAELGISRAHWSNLVRGRRRLTPAVARRAIQRWPSLHSVYLEQIAADIAPVQAEVA